MNTLKFVIDTNSDFDYFVYNCDQLLLHGSYNASKDNSIQFDLIPKANNKIKLFVFRTTGPVAITDIVFDEWIAKHATLSCRYYPIENEVEPQGTHFEGSHLSRDGYVLLNFQWPFDEWYFNWMDKEWNQHFHNS